MVEYFEIFSRDIVSLGIVDVYDECVWERRYFEAGYFELHVPATENNLRLLKRGNFIYKNGAEESGTITAVTLTEEDGVGKISVYGRFLSYLLHKHLIKGSYDFGESAESVMRQLVNAVVCNTDRGDYIPFIKLGEITNTAGRFNGHVDYGDLHDTLSAISKLSGTAFRLRLDPAAKLLYFECYEGKDRSINQTANPQVVFSDGDDNILSSATLSVDETPEVNAVTARYSGGYGELIVNWSPSNASGAAKKEIYIEGQAVTRQNSEGVTVLDKAATRAKLLQSAKEALRAITKDFTCAVKYEGEYKTGFDLGDIVTVYKKAWGVIQHLRIITLTENTTAAGYEVIPVFGEPYPSGQEV